MTAKEQAIDLFMNGGFNCSQSVFAPCCAKYGIDEKTALRITGAAGGGFRCGETCGAFAAGMLVVGLKYGQVQPKDLETKNVCNEKAIEFARRFKEINKSVVCRELLGCDTSTPEGKKYSIEHNLHANVCAGLIEGAVGLLEELGY